MRAPGQAPVAAGLGHADRAGQGPEVRVGERDVDRLQRQRVHELALVGGDHVGRRRQAGGAAELGHHLAAGEAVFGPARVFGVGQHVVTAAQQPGRFGQRPAAVRVERDARRGKPFVEGDGGFELVVAAQHAAFELEVGEAVARLGRFGQAHHGGRVERCLVAQPKPVVTGAGTARGVAIRQAGGASVADVEQIAEHGNRLALLAVAKQRRDGHAEVLAEQVEQGALEPGHGVDRGPQVEGLLPATADIAVGEAPLHFGQQLLLPTERLVREQAGRVDDHRRDGRAAGCLADAGAARSIADDDEVAGEERPVRAAQVEQHAVGTGDRNDADLADARQVAIGNGSRRHRVPRGPLRSREQPVRCTAALPRGTRVNARVPRHCVGGHVLPAGRYFGSHAQPRARQRFSYRPAERERRGPRRPHGPSRRDGHRPIRLHADPADDAARRRRRSRRGELARQCQLHRLPRRCGAVQPCCRSLAAVSPGGRHRTRPPTSGVASSPPPC